MSSVPRGLIEHDARLDILRCLEDEGPLTAPALSKRTGMPTPAVAYLLRPLDRYRLVKRTGDHEDGEPLYEACLDGQPQWVREAVEEHRRGKDGEGS